MSYTVFRSLTKLTKGTDVKLRIGLQKVQSVGGILSLYRCYRSLEPYFVVVIPERHYKKTTLKTFYDTSTLKTVPPGS